MTSSSSTTPSQTSAQSPSDWLLTPVHFLKGVGPERAELLARLGIRTAADLLFFFPRDYEDLTSIANMAELQEGVLTSVLGTVLDVDGRNTGHGKTVVSVLLEDATGRIRGVWFNQPFWIERFRADQRVLLSGKPQWGRYGWEMVHPRVTILEADDETTAGRIWPVYSLTEGLRQYEVRRAVESNLAPGVAALEEAFPTEFLAGHNLWPIERALREIHFPSSLEALEAARRRFIYQELFVLQLALSVRRQQQQLSERAPSLEATTKIDARIRRRFPFELTAGQQQVIDEIAVDMAQTHPMNRLLQGDVGSGKTIVAGYAMLLTVAHGHQAAIMAPTEILARQHLATFNDLLSASHVRIALLTGALTGSEREHVVQQLAAGSIDIVVGTHAVLSEDVQFAKLGLVVIDEQHKFGVRQRARLKQSGLDPHYLVMTATPIPRTVAMTVFGDLTVSTLRDHPPGRQAIHTYLPTGSERQKWWDFVCRKLCEGRQGYIVAPLIDEVDDASASSVQTLSADLAAGPLAGFRTEMLHGRMPVAERHEVIDSFRRHELDALIATTVIEVGVDVPNATLMTIYGGERFGLSQLHQLRGRVGRGAFPGYCAVFAEPGSDEAQERLTAFVGTTDGFELAELDFKLRGPGDLFGTRQHGLPPLRIADLRRDTETLLETRTAAQEFVADDPGLAKPEHARLRRLVLARYGTALDLADVG